MWPFSRNGKQQLACPNCQEKFFAKDVAFLCPERQCRATTRPLPGQTDQWRGKPLFRPARYAYSVPCPFSSHHAYIKICPRCWRQLPIPTGQSSTIGILGSSYSGKTCFITSLIRQVRLELSAESSLGMALEWDDDASKAYFAAQETAIFNRCRVPETTQRVLSAPIASMHLTLRFPIRRRWRRLTRGADGTTSLVFFDPSGEDFKTLRDLYCLNYFGNAESIILIVDPFGSEEFQKNLPAAKRIDHLLSPAECLRTFVTAMRREMNRPLGKLPKNLAVVLNKCDEPGMLDPDAEEYRDRFPPQGRRYDVPLAKKLSATVAQYMERELKLGEVVALARQNFREASFFTVSALGESAKLAKDEKGKSYLKLENPKPRRVEEPLLWILHRWGYI